MRVVAASLIAGLLLAIAGCGHFTARQESYRDSRSLDYLKPVEGIAIPRPDYTYRVPQPVAEKQPGEKREKPEASESVPPIAAGTDDAGRAAKAAVEAAPTATGKAGGKPEEIPDIPVFVERQTLTTRMPPATSAGEKAAKPARAVTTRNWFVVDAPPEKLWAKLVGYWMARKIPLVESNPVSGRIVTDWVPAIDPAARKLGVRDRFEVLLARDPAGSRITLKHRASRKTEVKNDKPAWAVVGVDPVLQGVETARLRDFLVGKSGR